MGNYFNDKCKELCCGCRGCEQICLQKCIQMLSDKEGFIYPIIDDEQCIQCGMCVEVCPIKEGGYFNEGVLEHPIVYAVYHKNETVLSNSTSGGAFTSIAQAFCDNDYVIFGAGYDKDMCVRHSSITDIKDINKFRGSKYVQSDTGSSFIEVKKYLNEGKKVLFSGTPCQVAGLKAFLVKDYENLLCMDFVCHGVPSPKIFEMYKNYLSEIYKSPVAKLNFRDKNKRGWITPYMVIEFENGRILKNVHSDNTFIIGFYKGLYNRPVCHACPFTKTPRVADVTMADFWGIEEINPEFYNKNKKGTSLVLVNTIKGNYYFDQSKTYIETSQECLENAKRFNSQLYRPSKTSSSRVQFMDDVQKMEFKHIKNAYLRPRPLVKRIISLLLNKNTKRKIKKILKVN